MDAEEQVKKKQSGREMFVLKVGKGKVRCACAVVFIFCLVCVHGQVPMQFTEVGVQAPHRQVAHVSTKLLPNIRSTQYILSI